MITIKDLIIEFHSLVLKVDRIIFNYGNIYGITGESGSGKSCFLDCVSLSKHDWDFSYFYNNEEIVDDEDFRSKHIAYLSQQDNLLEDLTCLQHISLIYGNKNISNDTFKRFSIDFNLNVFPNALSGGEKLRFTLLLAYLSQADILVLDEITASLDQENSDKIAELLVYLSHDDGKLIIFATHDQILKNICDTIYHIENCELIEERKDVHNSTVSEQQHKQKRNLLKDWVIPQYKNFNNKKLLLIMLSVLMLCMSLAGIQVAFARSELFKDAIDRVGREQSYLVSENKWLSNEILPFSSNDILDYLNTNENIISYYPFSNFMIASAYIDGRTYFNRGGLENNTLIDMEYSDGSFLFNYTVKNKNETRTVSKQTGLDRGTQSYIYPYHDESALDYKCTQLVEGEGIYLSADFATQLGIAELDEDTTVSLSFLVPTLRLQISINNLETGELLRETSKFVNYDVENATFKVKGILDRQYIQLNSSYLFYLDSKEYNSILEAHTNQIEAEEITDITSANYREKISTSKYSDKMLQAVAFDLNRYTDKATSVAISVEPFEQNGYTIFTAKNTSIKKIETDIKQLNEKYRIINMSEIMHQVKFNTDIIDKYFNSFSIIFIVIVLIFSFVINSFNKKKRVTMFTQLSRFGFSKKEFKTYLNTDIKLNILLNLGIGVILLLIANIMLIVFKFTSFSTIYLKSLGIAYIILLPASILLAFIQNFSSYALVKKHDKH